MVSLVSLLSKQIYYLVKNGFIKNKICITLKTLLNSLRKGDYKINNENLSTIESQQNVLRGLLKNDNLLKIFIAGLQIVLKNSGNIDRFDDLDDRMRIVKMMCGAVNESYAFDGIIVNGEPVSLNKSVRNGKTAIYNCPIEISKTITKGTIVMQKADELTMFSKEEESSIRMMVDRLMKHNGVVFCNGKVEPLFMDYFNENNAVVLNIPSSHDIRRLRNVVGGCVSPVLREVMENGEVSEIKVFEDGNRKYTKIAGKEGHVATMVLKSSISFVLDENERIMNKAITFIMKNYNEGCIKCVKGSGGFERELIKEVEVMMEKQEDSSRLVYKAFIDALTELAVKDCVDGVYDGFDAKMKAIQYAIEILCMVLNTDDYFLVRVNEMNIKPKTNKNWDNN